MVLWQRLNGRKSRPPKYSNNSDFWKTTYTSDIDEHVKLLKRLNDPSIPESSREQLLARVTCFCIYDLDQIVTSAKSDLPPDYVTQIQAQARLLRDSYDNYRGKRKAL